MTFKVLTIMLVILTLLGFNTIIGQASEYDDIILIDDEANEFTIKQHISKPRNSFNSQIIIVYRDISEMTRYRYWFQNTQETFIDFCRTEVIVIVDDLSKEEFLTNYDELRTNLQFDSKAKLFCSNSALADKLESSYINLIYQLGNLVIEFPDLLQFSVFEETVKPLLCLKNTLKNTHYIVTRDINHLIDTVQYRYDGLISILNKEDLIVMKDNSGEYFFFEDWSDSGTLERVYTSPIIRSETIVGFEDISKCEVEPSGSFLVSENSFTLEENLSFETFHFLKPSTGALDHFKFLEGIGTNAGLIYSQDEENDRFINERLLCYYQNDELLYHDAGQQDYCLSQLVTTNVTELSEEELRVYPNPAYDMLVVEQKNLTRLIIHDITGVKIFETHYSTSDHDKHAIDVTKFKSGIYSLSTLDKNGINSFRKIIIH